MSRQNALVKILQNILNKLNSVAYICIKFFLYFEHYKLLAAIDSTI